MRVEVNGVTKAFEATRTKALDGLSLCFDPGEIVCVIGLNGAGKTTLLSCLAGILMPTEGKILYDGKIFHREDLELRRRMAFLSDFPMLYGRMTTLEHIALILRAYECELDTSTERRVMDALEEFGMLDKAETTLFNMSRGQIYKSGLIAQIMVSPEF